MGNNLESDANQSKIKKYKINVCFNKIEQIIEKRFKMISFGFYEFAIQMLEMFVKYPVIQFSNSYAVQTILTLIYDIIFDIQRDQIYVIKK